MSKKQDKRTPLNDYDAFNVFMTMARAGIPDRKNMRSEAIAAKSLPIANVDFINMKLAGQQMVKIETAKGVIKHEFEEIN